MKLFKVMLGAIALAALAIVMATNSAKTEYVRDGIVYDSDVGAECGALGTDVLFAPWSTHVDSLDEPILDFVAACMNKGPLSDARVAVVGMADARYLHPSATLIANERKDAVVLELVVRGVDVRRLEPEIMIVPARGGDKTPDRVIFRIFERGPGTI